MATRFFNKKIVLVRDDDADDFVTTDAVQATSIEFNGLAGEVVSRELERAHFGGQPQVIVNQHQTLGFGVEFAAGSTAVIAQPWEKLLMASGFAKTVRSAESILFNPVTDIPTKCKLGLNIDGTFHELPGSLGTWTLEIAANGIPRWAFTFTGLTHEPTDTEALVGDYSAWQTPQVATNINTPVVSIFGIANIPLASFTLDLGTQPVHRSLVNAEPAVSITARESSGTLVVDARTLGAFDPFAGAKSGERSAIRIRHGRPDTVGLEVNMRECELGAPTYSNDNGVLQYNIPYRVLPISGNDEILISTVVVTP